MRLPVCMLLHPVGIGGTRDMNVKSAKIWLRALLDLLPDVIISAPWLPYAEANIDRERGLRDALQMMESCDAAVAVGGEFSRGMVREWRNAELLKLHLIDLTKDPMPAILTPESFVSKARSAEFRSLVTEAFRNVKARAAA